MLSRKLHFICLILCAIFLVFSTTACGDDGSTSKNKSAVVDEQDATGGDATGGDAISNNSTGNNSTGNNSTGNNSTGNNSTGNNSTGNNSTGNNTNPGNPGDDITDCLIPITAENLDLVNQARADEGFGALSCDLGLTRAAILHARDMCEQDYFEHDSLDGRTFDERINAMGVRWTTIGENIAYGQTSAAQVHTGWMNSPGHRANILNPNFGRIGIGYVGCKGRPYWVQDFAD